MRKTLYSIILFLVLLAGSVPAFAEVVTWPQAKNAAINFFKVTAPSLGRSPSVTLKYTKTETDGTVDFYVFNLDGSKGFVIISANDQVTPVIAYSLESDFNVNTGGKAIQSWLSHAASHIHQAILRHTIANADIKNKWSAYLQGTKPASAKSLSAVAPLLKTTWDQEPYYNQLCPFNSADNLRSVTGCAATTMAQIMKYWNYPARGTGYYSYNEAPPTYPFNYGSQSANFGGTTYNWAAMPNSVDSPNLAVATLMYHCGVSVGMIFGDDHQGGSGSYVLADETQSWRHSVQMAYTTYFKYNPNTLTAVHERDYSPSDWVALMESELSAGRPIQYEGVDTNDGGHTWVCDGYDENDMLHMNWGWSGIGNGYFSVGSLSTEGFNFSTDEAALIGIEPMSDLTVTASTSGSTICKGASVTLGAQGSTNVSYSWYPTRGLSCPTCATTLAKPDSTTTYTLTIDSAGLSASSQVTITVTASTVSVAMVNITNVTSNGANNGKASITVSGGTPEYSFQWSNGVSSAIDSNLAAGNYTVTISDAHGCTASAIANVTQPDSTAQQVTPASHGTSGRPLNPSNLNAAINNKGGAIYIQKDALVEVQGDLLNSISDSSGVIKNDGIIEISGNFQNDSGATFTVGTNSASTDRAVKFVGSGSQTISGMMSTAGKSSFYNLVIDQVTSSDTVALNTGVVVEGSLVFGTANTTTTYNPSSTYTNNNQKGLLKTFDNSMNEYLIDVQNGNADAISGYPVLEMGQAPSTGFILTSGERGTANGGLQRKISSATSYLYPIGTADKGFNALRMNFAQIPGGGSVKAKFCSGSSNPNGQVGTISQFCSGCENGVAPSNSGYNRYFPSNECNNGAPQWVVFENTLENHGYWSLASTNTGYTYDLEAFPNSYGLMDQFSTTRLLKHEASYGSNPSLASVDWRAEIDSLSSNLNDLLTYTRNVGCYTGGGIPGGIYKDFSHFAIGTGGTGSALPVQLLYLTAESAGKHHVTVSWATALEINNKGFFVMRSVDGINFTDMGWVNGHDNSTINQTYTFDDRVPQSTLYYYKLRQVDNNGKFVYSNLAQVNLSDQQQSDFLLYPNPTANDIFLEVKNPDGEVKVDVFDMKGELVYNNIFTIEQAGTEQTLTIHASSQMSQGTYILTASTNGEKFSSKVVLQ